MRGIFTAGVCDAFLAAGYNPFDLYIGVSSGACTLASYLSGQYQRIYRLITGPMRGREFIDPMRFLAGGHYMDLDWLWNYAAAHDPLDTIAATEGRDREFLVGVTDVETASACYLRPAAETLSEYLLASSALPVLYRRFVPLGGRLVTDGGVADPIPVMEAYRRGAGRIVVIRTRPVGKGKGRFLDGCVAALFLRRYPALRARIQGLHRVYEKAVVFMRHPPDGVEVRQIAPPPTLGTSRISADMSTIQADYRLGRQAGEEFIRQGQREEIEVRCKK
jgi:predicted patatin/cPLA2 family phospholipase